MLGYAMCVTVNTIFINFDIYLTYVTLVRPPNRLRNQLVARGRKRLCTTGLPIDSIRGIDLFIPRIVLFIHSFILETYIAPLQEITTQRRSQPSHEQKRT